MSRPPYGSHSGSRHACQKRPTSKCGWTRRAAAQTVVAQRVQGEAGKALLRDRGNESLRRRLSEGAPPRGAHAGDGFIVGGSCSRADAALGSALLVVKSGGKEVSHIEKNSDVSARRARGLANASESQESRLCRRRTRLPEPRRRPARLPSLAPGCVGHGLTSARAKPADTRCARGLGTRQNHPRWRWWVVRADQGELTKLPGIATFSSLVSLGVVHDQQRASYDVGS